MPGPVVQVGAAMMCPHGGQVSAVPTNTRVVVSGVPALVVPDTYLVAGCAFAVGPKPQPCVTVRWLVAATRVFANGVPLLIQSATGFGFSAEQAPQGPATVLACQTRVVAQ